MDLRQLETFVEVASLKSFSKAAKKLFLTQPTITNHIQNLEKEVGTILINRQGKGISLTDAGNVLFEYALNIINMRNTAYYKLSDYKGKIQGTLEISSSSIPKQYILPNILKSFVSKFPQVSFNINKSDSKNVIEDILEGYSDFGLVGAKYNNKNLEYIKIADDKLVVAVQNNEHYPFEPYTEIDLDFLLKENLILREEGSGTRLSFENYLKLQKINLSNLNIKAFIDDNETIKSFIKMGMGISIISLLSLESEIKTGTIKPYLIKDFNNNRSFYFVYHNKRHLSPLAQAFKEFMEKYIINKIL